LNSVWIWSDILNANKVPDVQSHRTNKNKEIKGESAVGKRQEKP